MEICDLNDAFRQTGIGGRVMLSHGASLLEPDQIQELNRQVQCYEDFSEENDPYGEHDFGVFNIFGHKFFWKIDYYDKELRYGSEDPLNPDITERVLTIMLASEY